MYTTAEIEVATPGVIRATVKVLHTEQELIHCIAKTDMPEYGLKKDEQFDLVRSSANDGTYYIVVTLPLIGRHCGCKGYQFRQSCRHTKTVNIRVAATHVASKHSTQPNTLVVEPAQAPHINVFKLTEDTIWDIAKDGVFSWSELSEKTDLLDHMLNNCVETLQRNKKIVLKQLDKDLYKVQTWEQHQQERLQNAPLNGNAAFQLMR